MIRQFPEFKNNKNFYAIDFSQPTISDASATGSAWIIYNAVWFKIKQKNVSVFKGTVKDLMNLTNVNVDDKKFLSEFFMENCDGRYGGNTEYRWDGEDMWAPKKTFQEMIENEKELTTFRNLFPIIPDGYTGWYNINYSE